MIKNYRTLKKNKKFIIKNFGLKYYKLSKLNALSGNMIRTANIKLQRLLYGDSFYEKLNNGKEKELQNENLKLIESYNKKLSDFNEEQLKNLALVVVRPESYYQKKKIKKYLLKNKLQLILSKTTQIGFEQYRVLYPFGSSCKDAQTQFPTRTLNYINHKLYIMVFYAKHDCFRVDNLCEFVAKLKGKPGCIQENTIRYEFCYKDLKKLIEKNKLQKDLYYLDAIGMYRAIIDSKFKCEDSIYYKADDKLIYFIGQCIHCPEYDELKKDISATLSCKDIRKIRLFFKNK